VSEINKTIVLLKEVESKICDLIRNNRVDEAVETIISYLAKYNVIIYEKPKAVIYAFDVKGNVNMVMMFTVFVVHIKESHIYIKPIFPFED